MESKKYDKLVNITYKKQTHRYRALVVTSVCGRGQHRGGGVGGTNYWVEDRLKDVLYNTGNTANIL